MKKAIVIGAGIAGLASAIRLQKKGYQVTVLESNSYPGGKLTEIKTNDFRFDAGPSLFTMPELVTELFSLCGKNPSDYFEYERLNTLCNYFFEDGTAISAKADINEFAKEIEKKTSDSAQAVIKHLKKSEFIYGATNQQFLQKSLHKISSYLSFNTLKSIAKLPFLDIYKSMNKANSNRFNDPKTIQLFNRYATYNGSNPYQAPGILNIIPHLEFNLGAYFPKNGMHSITKSIYQLALDMGVNFKFNEQAKSIITDKKKVIGVQTVNNKYLGNTIICNADIHTVYDKLLPNTKKLNQVDKQERSSSALIFYWGINQTFNQLDVHNILFSSDYKKEFETMFNNNSIDKDPTIYINISSKKNKKDAPVNGENWFVMINVPSVYKQDWDKLIKYARQNIINKINRQLNTNIEPLIVFEDVLSPQLIQDKTNSYKGSLYGTASNNKFAAFFRHKNFSTEYKGLYFVGGSVHPGGGIPLALSSAKIVDKLVK